ncbi:MAG: hypothetical protein OEO19_19220 [Gammaproteobacteria bacterium]|nr:hypothetical protein [Gammaproteobacteria bacterium]MDH3447159.1 hypothetical protein [Gammaproteobacteria bacterium]
MKREVVDQRKTATIVLNCFNENKTLRRIYSIPLFGLILLGLVVWLGFFREESLLVTITFAVYLVATTLEKMSYGFGVITYKRIVRMLLEEPARLEKFRTMARQQGLLKPDDTPSNP